MPMTGGALRKRMGDILRFTPIYDVVTGCRRRRELRLWKARGCAIPPPNAVKQMVVRQYGRRFDISTFVETGTYYGTMLYHNRKHFSRLHSIELDRSLYELARRKLAPYSNIRLHHGDSATVLPELLGAISERCLFWLDVHYSGPSTARAETDTPIRTELNLILRDDRFDHVILIDDARAFVGVRGYPTLAQLAGFVASRRKGWILEVGNDIVRMHAPPGKGSVS